MELLWQKEYFSILLFSDPTNLLVHSPLRIYRSLDLYAQEWGGGGRSGRKVGHPGRWAVRGEVGVQAGRREGIA